MQLQVNQTIHTQSETTGWQKLCRAGGIVSFVQLACIVSTLIVVSMLGGEPVTAAEYYTVLQNQRLLGLLRLDFGTVILISLFAVTPLSIFAAFRESKPAAAVLTAVLVYFGMLLALANHSAFSMIHLSDQYAAATPAQKELLLAAGEAIIASDMWHTTAGFLAGIFMQGGFAFISIVMLRGSKFGKATAVTGLVANGLDLLHVFIGLLAPGLAAGLLAIGGVFYLAWFPLLGRDLLRLSRTETR